MKSRPLSDFLQEFPQSLEQAYKGDPESYDVTEAMMKRIVSCELRILQLEGIVAYLERKR